MLLNLQRDNITAAKEHGGSIRQLSRLTGLSYGLIRIIN
jgi:lambda repressor-like predicted transcriptional regulator